MTSKHAKPATRKKSVLNWLPQIATTTTLSELDTCLRESLRALRNNPAYELEWFGAETAHSHIFTFDENDYRLLNQGEIIHHITPDQVLWSVLPLLSVTLRGWLALPHAQTKDATLLPLALQTAAMLAVINSHGSILEQFAELNLFNQIAQMLNSALELDPLLDAINQGITQLMGEQNSIIILFDQESRLFQILARIEDGVRTESRQQWTINHGLTSAIIRQRTSILTYDYLATCAEHNVRPILVNEKVPTVWVGVPMLFGERVIGVLAVYRYDNDEKYTYETVRKLEMLALRASDNVEQARLYERTKQQTRQLALLNELGRTITSSLNAEDVPSLIMGRVQELLDVEEGSLLLYDEPNNELVFRYSLSPFGQQLLGQRIPANAGIAGLVFRTRESLIANRAGDHPAFYTEIDSLTGHQTRDLLCVPLLTAHGPIGVIELINHRNGQPFGLNDRKLLEAVADQAVIAIENANLYTQTDRTLARRVSELDERNRQFQEILQIGSALKASTELPSVLPRLAQAIRTTARFNQVIISLLEMNNNHRPFLQRKVAAGIDDELFASLQTTPIDLTIIQSAIKRAYRRGENTYYFDHQLNHELRLWDAMPLYELPELRTGMWHPNDALITLLHGSNGAVLGMITALAPMNGLQPTADQIQTLEIFANQLGVAIENDQLYNQQQHNVQGLTALSALSMAINSAFHDSQSIWQFTIGGILDWTAALGAGVLIRHENQTTFEPVLAFGFEHTPDQALFEQAEQVFQRGRPWANTNNLPASILAAKGHSLLMLPLLGAHETLGVLYLWYPDLLPPPQEQDLIALFIGQAAVAVENMRLAAAVREGRDRLASILASTEEGFLLLDANLQYSEMNVALQGMINRSLDLTLVDQANSISHLINNWSRRWSNRDVTRKEISEAVQAIHSGSKTEARGQIQVASRIPRWFEWSALPVDTANKQPPYPLILALRDITAMIEAEHLRNDLTYMMIHDLRSPLSSVMTSLDLLSKKTLGEMTESQDKIINIALRSSVRLLDMVNLLLDISKLEVGQMPIQPQPALIRDVINAVIQNYEPMLIERDIHVEQKIAPNLPFANIDADKIERVIQNLFDNALKYSDPHSTITITASQATAADLPKDHPPGSWLLLTIHDLGPGIPEEYREKVFVKFSQLKEGVKGTGLGLTYCRLAVETHGGRIWVVPSDEPGALFAFTLPASEPQK